MPALKWPLGLNMPRRPGLMSTWKLSGSRSSQSIGSNVEDAAEPDHVNSSLEPWLAERECSRSAPNTPSLPSSEMPTFARSLRRRRVTTNAATPPSASATERVIVCADASRSSLPFPPLVSPMTRSLTDPDRPSPGSEGTVVGPADGASPPAASAGHISDAPSSELARCRQTTFPVPLQVRQLSQLPLQLSRIVAEVSHHPSRRKVSHTLAL